MIIGVTGSREWTSREIISTAFDEIVPSCPSGDDENDCDLSAGKCHERHYREDLRDHDPDLCEMVLVVNGYAPGADRLCDLETLKRGWLPVRVPANWGSHGKAAGPYRNKGMLCLAGSASGWIERDRITAWLAFIIDCAKPDCSKKPSPHPSHGTWDCMNQARDSGINVKEYRND